MKSPVHFTRGGRRVRCGVIAKKTITDTRIKAKVTCKNCLKAIQAESK